MTVCKFVKISMHWRQYLRQSALFFYCIILILNQPKKGGGRGDITVNNDAYLIITLISNLFFDQLWCFIEQGTGGKRQKKAEKTKEIKKQQTNDQKKKQREERVKKKLNFLFNRCMNHGLENIHSHVLLHSGDSSTTNDRIP